MAGKSINQMIVKIPQLLLEPNVPAQITVVALNVYFFIILTEDGDVNCREKRGSRIERFLMY